MKLKQLLTDDSAVSPVIGIILMVAITVILAAIIGTFVLGLGDSVNNTAPQATFSFEYEQNESGSDLLTITHEVGDTIEGQNLNITSDGATNKAPNKANAYVGTDVFSGEITAGTEATVDNTIFKSAPDPTNVELLSDRSGPNSQLDLSGATIRVVYSDETGGSSATLAKWEGPDA
jgi:flagellin-like protein